MSNPITPTVIRSIVLDRKIDERLTKESLATGLKKSEIVRQALDSYLRKSR